MQIYSFGDSREFLVGAGGAEQGWNVATDPARKYSGNALRRRVTTSSNSLLHLSSEKTTLTDVSTSIGSLLSMYGL